VKIAPGGSPGVFFGLRPGQFAGALGVPLWLAPNYSVQTDFRLSKAPRAFLACMRRSQSKWLNFRKIPNSDGFAFFGKPIAKSDRWICTGAVIAGFHAVLRLPSLPIFKSKKMRSPTRGVK
jgi:hypothetical protein